MRWGAAGWSRPASTTPATPATRHLHAARHTSQRLDEEVVLLVAQVQLQQERQAAVICPPPGSHRPGQRLSFMPCRQLRAEAAHRARQQADVPAALEAHVDWRAVVGMGQRVVSELGVWRRSGGGGAAASSAANAPLPAVLRTQGGATQRMVHFLGLLALRVLPIVAERPAGHAPLATRLSGGWRMSQLGCGGGGSAARSGCRRSQILLSIAVWLAVLAVRQACCRRRRQLRQSPGKGLAACRSRQLCKGLVWANATCCQLFIKQHQRVFQTAAGLLQPPSHGGAAGRERVEAGEAFHGVSDTAHRCCQLLISPLHQLLNLRCQVCGVLHPLLRVCHRRSAGGDVPLQGGPLQVGSGSSVCAFGAPRQAGSGPFHEGAGGPARTAGKLENTTMAHALPGKHAQQCLTLGPGGPRPWVPRGGRRRRAKWWQMEAWWSWR